MRSRGGPHEREKRCLNHKPLGLGSDGQNGLTPPPSLRGGPADAAISSRNPAEPIQAILDTGDEYSKAYLVLGGEGWKLRDFYTRGGLEEHLEYANKVDIITLENFIARANQGRL